MCTLEQLKQANDMQHEELKKSIKTISTMNDMQHENIKKSIKNIGLVNKVLISILLGVFGLILLANVTYLRSIASYSEKSYKVRVETSTQINSLSKNMWLMENRLNKQIKELSDTTRQQINRLVKLQEQDRAWTHEVYRKQIRPTYLKVFKK